MLRRTIFAAARANRATFCRVASAFALAWVVGTAVPGPPASAQSAPSASAEIDPLDWPNWRGPEQNRISRETGLVAEWDPEGENLLWHKPELELRGTPIVMRGKLYTLARSDIDTTTEGEKVVCLDAATGDLIWERKFNVFLTDVPNDRVGWSCVAGDPATGRVYAQGVCGYFQCLEGESGEVVWARSLSEEFGLVSTYGGRTNTPVVFEDLVLISAVMTNYGDLAVPAHRFLAMDKATGEPIWLNGTRLRPEDTTYSTPTLTVLNGQAALVFGSGDGGVHAFQPRTGKPIWNFNISHRGINSSPVVVGDTVYVGNGEENLAGTTRGAVVAVDGALSGDITKTGALWRAPLLTCGNCSLVHVDGRLYCVDDNNLLYVLDAKTGKQIQKVKLTGTFSRATPLYADGKLYVCTLSAWHAFEIVDDGLDLLHKLRFDQGEEVFGSPIASHGRIYLPTSAGLYCIGKAGAQPAAGPIPPAPQENPADQDRMPAHVQVAPFNSLIKPGESIQFRVKLFNARGQFLRDATDAKFSVDRGGQIGADGKFVADSDPAHVALNVTAEVEGLKGAARARIVPPLPWKFDFNDAKLTANPKGVLEGDPPNTWIGATYRHKIREIDGEKAMVKVTTIPKGTRSQCWMGHTDLHDYTVQADVRGAIKDRKMPDIGLIAQRYTLDMKGQSQELEIRTWTPQLTRFSKAVRFAWKPNVWYTMKFRASVEDGKAVLKGKAWPRGETEPEAWSIEAEDAAPTIQGSPGLFGQATSAEIYIDNISVTPNE